MTDYGRPIQFGAFLPPSAASPHETLRLAGLADRLGLDLLGVQDHPNHPGLLDAWTLLAVIAAQTERIRVFPDVANLPLRPPIMLAKAAASLDLLTTGRVALGIGAGANPQAAAAMGAAQHTASSAVAALAEAVQVIRLAWRGQANTSFSGKHYQLEGIHPGPTPAHRIEIWVGAYGPRMLEVTGRLADGWIPSHPFAPPQRLGALTERLDDAAASAGRPPSSIRRLYNISGTIGAATGHFLHGPAEAWKEQLTGLALEHGIDSFVLAPAGNADDQLRHFALDVSPAVRHAVDKERARGKASV